MCANKPYLHGAWPRVTYRDVYTGEEQKEARETAGTRSVGNFQHNCRQCLTKKRLTDGFLKVGFTFCLCIMMCMDTSLALVCKNAPWCLQDKVVSFLQERAESLRLYFDLKQPLEAQMDAVRVPLLCA